ncbi:N-acyl-phosphatidylethanolamine-hydrolyzing phospholipase D [Acrasis kona]|uniref:N-acyl-phosphatidylethanolamine-hydrolyzing phospholipase D n=1 Tax=Acrasis kona TaxID=1008807 RepID=A0AAW2ZKR9_9EUKA
MLASAHQPNTVLPKHHVGNGTFQNVEHDYTLRPTKQIGNAITMLTHIRGKKPEGLVEHPICTPNFEAIHNPDPNVIQYTWIGHSSFLVQFGGYNILTDPVFCKRASPTNLLGPKRLRPVPMTVEQLPRIDIITISHNHYDHCDRQAIKAIFKKFGEFATIYVPLNLKTWTQRKLKNIDHSRVIEMDWWQSLNHNFGDTSLGNMEITFLPAQHWSNRTFFDYKKSLWGGWGFHFTPNSTLLKSRCVYHCGDSGYSEIIFKDIGEKYSVPRGNIDLAFIPIGAYAPTFVLQVQHVDPTEAYLASLLIKCKKAVAMHWGTFDLSLERIMEPKEKLEKVEQVYAKGRPPTLDGEPFFMAVNIGETKMTVQ